MTDYADAQRMVLSSGFHNGGAIWEYVHPGDLDTPYQNVANALQAMHVRGTQIDVTTLTSECLTRGFDPMFTRWMMGPVATDDAHAAFLDARGATLIEKALLNAQQHIVRGVDHWRVVDDMVADLHTIPRPMTDRPPGWHTWTEAMAMRDLDDEVPWVLPGLLRRGERCVLTGGEGLGKSTLIYQLVVGALYGVSPVDTDRQVKPQRVMVLDVENWHETAVAGHLRTLGLTYKRLRHGEVEPEFALLKARVINLIQPDQRRLLLEAVDAFQPNLLVMGSGYKLVDATEDWRVMATTIQRTADEARARTGCAVIIETHAGHGSMGDRNGWRPDGSSYWLRWPEFGFGLEPIKDTHGHRRMARVHRWRWDRVMDRAWPAGWCAGGTLPWRPMDEDEMDALDL